MSAEFGFSGDSCIPSSDVTVRTRSFAVTTLGREYISTGDVSGILQRCRVISVSSSQRKMNTLQASSGNQFATTAFSGPVFWP